MSELCGAEYNQFSCTLDEGHLGDHMGGVAKWARFEDEPAKQEKLSPREKMLIHIHEIHPHKVREEYIAMFDTLTVAQEKGSVLQEENRVLRTRLAEAGPSLLPGWTCENCKVFNGSAKENLPACRCCGMIPKKKPCECVTIHVKDPTSQDLLWEYAQRHRWRGELSGFSDDLEAALIGAGFKVAESRQRKLEAVLTWSQIWADTRKLGSGHALNLAQQGLLDAIADIAGVVPRDRIR